MKKILASVVLLLGLTAVLAAQDYNCFSIIAGRNATVDGSVLMAHNEDDSGEQMLNIYVVPATDKNLRYIWCEFPGMEVSDVFMNQFGVSVASNGCPSREDKADLKGKGVLYEIRTSVAKYARTAREAVAIIGSMVETFGYSGSGRSYIVADPSEGWVISVVKGRHWVAQRVPDDKVMTIPNYYVIGAVDLDDEENFAGSDDLVEYAISRGWYDPAKDGDFSFARAYSSEKSIASTNNQRRHHQAWTYFFGMDRPGEFASVPMKKVSLRDMMNVLAIHDPNPADRTVRIREEFLPLEVRIAGEILVLHDKQTAGLGINNARLVIDQLPVHILLVEDFPQLGFLLVPTCSQYGRIGLSGFGSFHVPGIRGRIVVCFNRRIGQDLFDPVCDDPAIPVYHGRDKKRADGRQHAGVGVVRRVDRLPDRTPLE